MRAWRPASVRDAGVLALVVLAVAASAWFSIDLTRAQNGVSAVWIANGLMLGVLMRRPTSHWPLLFGLGWFAQWVPRVAHGDPMGSAFVLATINLAEIWLMAGMIRRREPDIDAPERLLSLSRISTTSAIAACLLSATAAALVRNARGTEFLEVWLTWFSAHLLGAVVVGTVVVVAMREGLDLLGKPGRRADFAGCLLLLAATCFVVFVQDRYPLLFLAYPPLVLLTYRHGLAGVVMGIMVIAVASGASALRGTGPFELVHGGGILEGALLTQLFVGVGVLLGLPVALVLTARRRLAAQVRESEARYRLLADHARDIVVRMRDDGTPLYVSPSVRDILGWEAAEFTTGIVHPDDLPGRDAAIARLLAEGGDAKIAYRVRHKDGRLVWLEILATRVAVGGDGAFEVVYAGRDVTARVAAEEALARNRQRLQSLIDGIPAMVAHIDTGERYTFANRMIGRMLQRDLHSIVGRTLREVRGEAAYEAISTHVQAALRGEPQTFEGCEELGGGRRIEYQCSYVPEYGPDGAVRGFYSLTTDITALKQAERKLEQLAREDPLTGLANRRQFEERLEQAVIRARRQELPIALMLLDVDYFKQINDTHGHPAGDAVLQAFAQRIRASIYDVDLVARLGGDEFVVLFEYAGGIQLVATVARRILKAMEAPIPLANGVTVQVGTSIGIGFLREATYGLSLIALADRALYAAKQAGRGTFRVSHD